MPFETCCRCNFDLTSAWNVHSFGSPNEFVCLVGFLSLLSYPSAIYYACNLQIMYHVAPYKDQIGIILESTVYEYVSIGVVFENHKFRAKFICQQINRSVRLCLIFMLWHQLNQYRNKAWCTDHLFVNLVEYLTKDPMTHMLTHILYAFCTYPSGNTANQTTTNIWPKRRILV